MQVQFRKLFRRKFFSLLVLCFVINQAFLTSQSNSAVSIFEKLYTIETEYFDIIFSQASEQTAQHLAHHADNLYLKAAELLDVQSLERIPVVITQKTDVLNAYYTFLPYSRIVMYDTLPTETLAVFDDSFLSVFYHELIHAVTLRLKTDSISLIDDFHSILTAIDFPPSITEGTAVFAESFDGYGRLNDSYSMHVIRQAKIEGAFPDWSDIAGANTLYVDGSLPYIFGGAFTEYLYKEYGIDKLVEYWNISTKFDLRTYTVSFKKIYGLSIHQAWENFEESIVIPSIETRSEDFYDSQHLFNNVTAFSEGLAWQDAYSGNVYYLHRDDPNKKADYLFTTSLSTHLSFSRDGKFLTSSGVIGGVNKKNTAAVFDVSRKKIIADQQNIRDATVIQLDDVKGFSSSSPFYESTHVLAGIKTSGQVGSMMFYSLDNLDSASHEISFDYGVIPLTPVDAGNGIIIVPIRNHGVWQIFIYNMVSDTQKTYVFESSIDEPRNLAGIFAIDSDIYMSFGESRFTQPVLATFNLNDLNENKITLFVQEEQRSGGVFSPVVFIEAGEEKKVVHLSRFFEHRELSVFSLKNTSFKQITLVSKETQYTKLDENDFSKQKYNPAKYYTSPLFIPLIGSVNLNPISDEISQSASLGLSLVFLDPAERLLTLFGGGYDPINQRYSTTLSTVFTEQNFTLTGDTYWGFNSKGTDLAATKIHADIFTPIVSNYNRLGVINSFRWFYQKNTNDLLAKGNTIDNVSSVYFLRERRVEESPYSLLGFMLLYQFQLEQYYGNDSRYTNNLLFGNKAVAEVFLPKLLPFNNPSRFTINMPFTVSLSKYFNYSVNWEANANVVLFSYDIQEAISFLHVFFQRITLDSGVRYSHFTDDSFDLHVLASLYTTTSLNTSLATGYPIDIGLSFDWDTAKKGVDSMQFGLKFAMNF